jgi:hypothetical protein
MRVMTLSTRVISVAHGVRHHVVSQFEEVCPILLRQLGTSIAQLRRKSAT